jgi:hypothetical protein
MSRSRQDILRPGAGTAALPLPRLRRTLLIAMGWIVIALGLLAMPLPGPVAMPTMAVGALILLRHSPSFRRRFVRLRRRWPRVFAPVERMRRVRLRRRA